MENSTSPDPLIGSTFGAKYRIVSKLGAGGMGGVYLAEHLLMNRQVALKLLRSNLIEDEVLQKRFQNEAKAASQISHPNAVTLFDFGVNEGVPYLVMEYIQGRTLKLVIDQEKPLALDRVANILMQLAEALHSAHRLGIVHRDIKPDNFMVRIDQDGREVAKVLDFGIAKSIGPSNLHSESNLTQVGMLVGTPQYMSPEQCQGKELDIRCDVYSLGTVVYEMITGEPPFRAPSVLELLVRVLNSPAEPMRTFRPDLKIPEALDAVVLRSLEKDPAKRFPSMIEFGRAFQKALDDSQPKPPASRRKAFALVGAGAALVLVMGLVYGRSAPVPSNSSPAEIEEHQRALKEAEAEKQRLLERAAKERAEAERSRQETERLKVEQGEAARKAEAERQTLLDQAAKAREAIEKQKQQAEELARQKVLEDERNQAALKLAEEAQQLELKHQEELARKAEAEKQEALKQAEAARIEAQKQADIAKAEAARLVEAARKIEEEKAALMRQMKEAEQRQKATSPVAVPTPVPQRSVEDQKKLDESIRKANEQRQEALKRAEDLRKEAERQAAAARIAAEQARRAKEDADERARQAAKQRAEQAVAVPTAKPVATEPPQNEDAPKPRRRCGPTWCM